MATHSRPAAHRSGLAGLALAVLASPAAAQTLPPLPMTSNEQPSVSSIAGVAAVAENPVTVQLTGGVRVNYQQSIVGTTVIDQIVVPIIKIPGRPPFEADGFVREALVNRSFESSTGLFALNQDVGVVNNQLNIIVLNVRDPGSSDQGVNMEELVISGGARFEGNTIVSSGGTRQDRIQNSFANTTGAVAVNQSAGAANQQSNILVLGFGTATDPEKFVALAEDKLGAVDPGQVPTEGSEDTLKTKRFDTLTDSFTNFKGIAQVAQSAGNGNIVSNQMTVSVPSSIGAGLFAR